MGLPIFLIFYSKHRLWVLEETPQRGGSNVYVPTINVLSKNIKIFPMKYLAFTAKKNIFICMGKFS